MNEVTQVTLPVVVLVSVAIAMLGGTAALVRIIARNFEKTVELRFTKDAELRKVQQESDTLVRHAEQKQLVESLARVATDMSKLATTVHRVEVELPREFVRRDDHVQALATVTAKTDAVQAQGAHILSLVAEIRGQLAKDK